MFTNSNDVIDWLVNEACLFVLFPAFLPFVFILSHLLHSGSFRFQADVLDHTLIDMPYRLLQMDKLIGTERDR